MGKLKVILYHANNLAVESTWGYNDPTCHVSVGTITHAVSAPKSSVNKIKQINPIWNQDLYFEIDDPGKSAYLRITFYDVDNNDREIPIGEVWVSLVGLVKGKEWKSTLKLNNSSRGEITLGLMALDYSPPTSNGYLQTPQQQQQHQPQPPAANGYNHSPSYNGYIQQQQQPPPISVNPQPQQLANNNINGYIQQQQPPPPISVNPQQLVNNNINGYNHSPNNNGYISAVPGGQVVANMNGYSPSYNNNLPPLYQGHYQQQPQQHQVPQQQISPMIPQSNMQPHQAPQQQNISPMIPHQQPPPSQQQLIPQQQQPPPQQQQQYLSPPPVVGAQPVSQPINKPSGGSRVYQQQQPPSSQPVPVEKVNGVTSGQSSAPSPQPQPQSLPQQAGGGGGGRSLPSRSGGESGQPHKTPSSQSQRWELIRFNPGDLQRDFPHIAKGSFGVVFKGRAANIKGVVVIKDMEIQNQRSVEDWKKEIVVMSQYRNPYVVEIYGYCSHQKVLTIVMEYMANGDLYGILHKHSKKHPLSMLQRLRMARHCALGLAFLHSNRVIHRDVKSMNILVTEDYSCKLTDFGCAKLITDPLKIENTVNSGTPLWMAPEVKRGNYSLSADIYSLGLVLYELFERKLPEYDQIHQTVSLPPSYQSRSVIRPCLNENPIDRPTAGQVVKVLDKLIRNILSSVRTLLPEGDQEKLRMEAYLNSEGKDPLEVELVQLYRQLLSEPPFQVDQLISQGFQISLEGSPTALPFQPQSAASPSYIPGNMAYVQQPAYYITPSPQYQPSYHQIYNPPSFPASAPPPYSGGVKNAHAYTPAAAVSDYPPPPAYKDVGKSPSHELNSYLEQLNVSELKGILSKYNISETSISRQELIEKIVRNIPPNVVLQG